MIADAFSAVRRRCVSALYRTATGLSSIPSVRPERIATPSGSPLLPAILELAFPVQHAAHRLAALVATVTGSNTAGRTYRGVAARTIAKLFWNLVAA